MMLGKMSSGLAISSTTSLTTLRHIIRSHRPSGSLNDPEPDLLQWVVLHSLVLAFAFCNLGSMARALASED